MFTVLEFHNISSRGICWTNMPAKRFADVLDLLQAETHVVAPTDLEHYLNSQDDSERPHVMLSFDDGYEEIYTTAYPMMRERGLAGMVSTVAGYVGKRNLWDIMGGGLDHLGWHQLEELLAAGWSICSHTMTHPDLKRCTDDRLTWELEQSKQILEKRLGLEIPAVAYPFGRFNSRVLRAAQKTGYRIGFTVGAEVWKGVRGPLTTIRVPVYQIDSDPLIRAKVAPDGFLKRLDAFKNRFFNRLSLLTSFAHRHRFKGIPQQF